MKVENDQVKIEQKLFGKRNLQRNLHIYIYTYCIYVSYFFWWSQTIFWTTLRVVEIGDTTNSKGSRVIIEAEPWPNRGLSLQALSNPIRRNICGSNMLLSPQMTADWLTCTFAICNCFLFWLLNFSPCFRFSKVKNNMQACSTPKIPPVASFL